MGWHDLVAAVLVGYGAWAYRRTWVCQLHPERAGVAADPRMVLVAVAMLIGTIGFVLAWIHQAGAQGLGPVLQRAGVSLVMLLLQFPFVSYQIAEGVGRRITGESLDDGEPEDEFARARSTEERGDVRGAIDLYSLILKADPLRTDARIRLGGLLAASRRMSQVQELVRGVLTRDDLPDADRAELAALLMRWEGGAVVADAPSGPGHRGREVSTVRMEAHLQQRANDGEGDHSLPA